MKLTGHTYVLQQFDKFWIWRSICKTRTAEIWQKDILTLDGLEKGQLIQLDDVTRIKLAFRNQGQLAPFVCYLVFKIGNFAIDITEQKKFLSNCSKQLVTPVNLTSELPKLKTAFYESHFPHCVIPTKYKGCQQATRLLTQINVGHKFFLWHDPGSRKRSFFFRPLELAHHPAKMLAH